MQLNIMSLFQNDLRQIELLAAEISEGVIILDTHQSIVWANAAALAMHGVAEAAALGQTIDDYHATFQVRFRSSARAPGVAATERARDTLIELTPANGDGQRWLNRMRKMAVADENGALRYTVLVLTAISGGDSAQGKLVSFIQAAPGAVAVLRRHDNAIIDANAAFRRLMDMDLTRGPDRTAANTLIGGSEDPAHVRDSIAEAMPFPFLLTHIPDSDGHLKPALFGGQPAEYAGESCMILNIVEWEGLRPAVQAAALQDPTSLHAFAMGLCAAAPGPAYVLDRDMQVVAASKSWLEWLGYTAETATGRKITEFMTTSSASHFADQTWATLAGGGVVRDHTCHFVKRSGDAVESLISAHGAPGDGGSVTWAVVMTVDVTERQRSEDRFSKLFALSPTPLLVRRVEDNRILDANDAFMAMTGYTAEAVIGHCAEELWHFGTKTHRQTVEQDLRAGKRVQNVDVKLKTTFGEALDSLLSGERVSVFGQNCVLLAFQDVTDRRRSEAELFSAIETVMEDTTWFTQSVIEKLATLRRPARPGAPAPEIGDLTPREREVLGLISHGMTDTDIAEKLGLTRCTVRNHVATLYSKIGVHSRSSAIVWARERGVNLAWPLKGPANFMRQTPAAAAAQRKIVLPAKSRRP